MRTNVQKQASTHKYGQLVQENIRVFKITFLVTFSRCVKMPV